MICREGREAPAHWLTDLLMWSSFCGLVFHVDKLNMAAAVLQPIHTDILRQELNNCSQDKYSKQLKKFVNAAWMRVYADM